MARRDGESKRGPKPYHTSPDRVVEALRTARNLISNPSKWWRGSYQSGRGHQCLEAAIRDACNGDQYLTFDAMRVMREVLGIRHVHSNGTELVGRGRQPSPIRSLFDWNDAPGRTHDEVLAALDDGAASAEWIMNPREVFA